MKDNQLPPLVATNNGVHPWGEVNGSGCEVNGLGCAIAIVRSQVPAEVKGLGCNLISNDRRVIAKFIIRALFYDVIRQRIKIEFAGRIFHRCAEVIGSWWRKEGQRGSICQICFWVITLDDGNAEGHVR